MAREFEWSSAALAQVAYKQPVTTHCLGVVLSAIDQLVKDKCITRSSNKLSVGTAFAAEDQKGRLNFYIDYSRLDNEDLRFYPIPSETALQYMTAIYPGGYYTKVKFLSQNNYAWPMKVPEKERHKTVFSVAEGINYEWLVHPYDLPHSEKAMQRMMDKLFAELKDCVVRIDTVIFASPNEAQHMEDLIKFLRIARDNGLSIEVPRYPYIGEPIPTIDNNDVNSYLTQKQMNFGSHCKGVFLEAYPSQVNMLRDLESFANSAAFQTLLGQV